MKEKRAGPVIVSVLSLMFPIIFLSLTVQGGVLPRGGHQPGRTVVSGAAPTAKDLAGARPVRMRQGSFYMERDFLPQIRGARGHVLIQLAQPLSPVIEKELRAQGVELLEYIPENTWKAVVPAGGPAAVKALASVQAMGSIYPVDKFPVGILERGLAPSSRNADGTISILVSFYRDVPFQRVRRILADLGGATTQTGFISGRRVLLKIPAERLSVLAECDEVNWIENRPRPKRSNNAAAAALSNVDDLHAAPYNLDGLGVALGMWDAGEAQADHPDIAGRVTIVEASDVSSHTTHVAGTMISSGAGNTRARGMAPAGELYVYDFDGDVPTEMSGAVGSYGVILSNHSWGYATGWSYNSYGDDYWVWFGDEDFGNYTSTSQAWDQTVFDTGMLVVKSAGNDRNDDGDQNRTGHRHFGEPNTLYYDYHPSDGIYDCVGQIGSSKNVITVGAVADDGAMTAFSSYGPTDDGRIKPDLVANGAALYSTCPLNDYCIKSGTSMSSPVISGSIALIVQRYTQVMGTDPTPDTIKALLVATAFELGEKGPDYSFGWGLVDVKSAVDLVENRFGSIQTGTLSNAEIVEYPLAITSGDKVVRVTLAWTDPAASPAASKALVNDIDLELIDPSGGVHLPWVLDGANPSLPASRGVNTVDNIEQVHLMFPAAGTWTIRVKGTSIQGSQSFSLVTLLRDEFQVNLFDAWDERNPSAAALTNGRFVVTWDSADLLYTTVDTYGRVFDAQGYPVGDDFRLNQTTADTQEHSAVAALGGGGFVAVWDSRGQDGSSSGVYGRVFDNDGNPATDEFQVNVYTTYAQQYPTAAGFADGRFLVSWGSTGQDGSDKGVFARLFNAGGSPLTGDLQLNTTTFNDQSGPSVAVLQSGGFVAAWKSWGQDGSGYGIFGRLFDAAGNPQTGEFQVNTYTAYSQYACTVTALGWGGFVVVWKSFGQDGDGAGIYGQVFDAGGNKIGGEFQVNTYTRNDQADPTVSPLAGGGFVVIWQSYGQDGNYNGIFAREYDTGGNAKTGEYQLNIYTVHDQTTPCATLLASGDVLTAWDSVLQAGSGIDVFAKVLPAVEDCPGDFDHDSDVDGTDLAVFAADFGRSDCGVPTTCPGDFDSDGDVDGSDLAVFAADFGRTDCPKVE